MQLLISSVWRLIIIILAFFSTTHQFAQDILFDDAIVFDDAVVETTYKRALQTTITILADLQALHNGAIHITLPEEYGIFFDLNIGRLVYLKYCLERLVLDYQRLGISQDLLYLAQIVQSVYQESSTLLFYEADRSACFEQILKDVMILMARFDGIV